MEEYLTARDVAAWLNVSLNWVYTHTKSGEIPSVRIGRKLFYSHATIASVVLGATDSA